MLETEKIVLTPDLFRPADFITAGIGHLRTALMMGGVLVVLLLLVLPVFAARYGRVGARFLVSAARLLRPCLRKLPDWTHDHSELDGIRNCEVLADLPEAAKPVYWARSSNLSLKEPRICCQYSERF